MPEVDANAVQPFQSVGQYAWPSMPADDLVRSLYSRFRRKLGEQGLAPSVLMHGVLSLDELRHVLATSHELHAVSSAP